MVLHGFCLFQVEQKSEMDIKGVGLLLILLSHLCFPASPSPSTPQPISVPLQEKGLQEGVAVADAKSRHQVIRHSIKTGHGHGGGGATVANPGESTTTPATQGGTAVIPVYAAGAANNNHHPSVHHSVASRNQQSLGPLNLCASVMAILVLRVYHVCEFEN